MTDRLAKLLMPAIRWREDTGFDHEAEGIDLAMRLGVGGFIIFGGPAPAVRKLTARLREQAGRPLLLGADLERGAGQQFAGLSELPPPGAMGALGDLEMIRAAGAETAREARTVGIDWVFAPVADLDCEPDNPIIQTRAFGAEPERVARCVAAWVEGCQSAGALACVKHFPGHGRAATDSHAGLPVVQTSRAELETDLLPFTAAFRAGVASCMTAHVAFPALDPAGRPATRSPAILSYLRSVLGFDGAIVSDALIMEGVLAGRGAGEACVDALASGVDLLLYPEDVAAAHEALVAAVEAGRLPAARVNAALASRERLVRRHATLVDAAGPVQSVREVGMQMADRLLERPLARGAVPCLTRPLSLHIVDDDLGGPYPPGPSDWVARTLASADVALADGGSPVVLVFAEPRAWKGRAGLGAASQARLAPLAADAGLIVLFGHPRLAASMPGNAPVLVAWHRQRLMQEAVARWLVARLTPRDDPGGPRASGTG